MKNVKPSAPKKARRWRRVWWAALLILVLAGGAAGWYVFIRPGSRPGSQQQTRSTAQTGPKIYTSPVKRGDLRVSAAGAGKLVAYQSMDLSFSTSGTVSELNVKLGDTVQAGQLLASLGDSQTLEANLAAAKLQVLNAQKALTDLQNTAGLSLAQAYSDLITAQDTYNSAQTTSQRMAYARCGESTATRLAENLARATKQLASIRAEKSNSDVYIAAKKAYDTAAANYNECAAYTTPEKASAASALEVAQTALQEAQDKYDTLKAASGIDPNALAMDEANLKVAQAKLAKAEDDLAGVRLTAPMDGKITYLAASARARVGTDKFITIIDANHAALDISVNESDMSKLVQDAPVTVTFDALPNQTFTGKVVQVNPDVTVSGQYRVVKGKVLLDDSALKTVSSMPLGVSASVTLNPQQALDALLIPTIALQKQDDGSYLVTVQSSDGQLTTKKVTIGIHDNDYTEITSGLNEGELVSTGTVQFVAAGSTTSSQSLKNAQNSGGPREMPGGPMP